MTFKTTIRDDRGQAISDLLVTANNEMNGESFSRSTDGSGYADVAMLGTSKVGDRVTFSVADPQYRFMGYVAGDAFQVTAEDQTLNLVLVPFV